LIETRMPFSVRRIVQIAVAWVAALAPVAPAAALLVGFLGAEGFGRLATGGRGGDVYRVTNLNDTGAGSLRNGIVTAPAGGRTIVFEVAGQINLASRLLIDNKSKLTIAGQTAPAGGITLAHQELTIEDSNNIVLQHLRIRPGDKFPATHAPNPSPTYNPDAIGVLGSSNVIIDHVTASWGVDETISVTSNSDLVTVQWSTMTQGLYNAGHSDEDGVGHSYGSLLNGGRYSFHHNLYAHSKSRHPRAQDSGNLYLQLDWVNNVIYNPGDEFGNSDSDDPYDMNLVGNYGIKGVQSGSNTSYLMRPQDVDSRFYLEGNMTDIDRDLVLDGLAVNGASVFRPGSTFTLMPARFDLPQVTTHSAEQAYVQVISRAGASRHRDEIDLRTLRTVMNHLPGQIQTQADWGGWPTLPTGAAAPDANGDGVPDAWATANGFNPATPLNTAFAPDGYTYLEKYIHSLTPNAYAPTGTTTHTIRTSFGGGADADVSEIGGASAVPSGNGSAPTLDVRWTGPTGSVNTAALLRFDVSQLVAGTVNSARLDLTAAAAIGAGTFTVYGLEHGAADWDWSEASVTFATAPGVTFDGSSHTLGINSTFTTTSHPDVPDVLNLGEITVPAGGVAAGATLSLTNLNLAVFLNLGAYADGPTGNLVTLLVQPNAAGTPASFVSKESDPLLAPRLVVDARLATAFDVADFDGSRVVDGGDLVNWRQGFGTTAGAGRAQGDADLDGDVDGNDYLVWQRRLGTTMLSAADAAVPEPAAGVLALGAGACAQLSRVRSRRARA
jgi:pectate lyase